MSIDSRASIPFEEFFTNLQKQFIGACALFVTRSENFARFGAKSQEFILDNFDGLTHLTSWLRDPEADCKADDSKLAAFVLATAQSSAERNIKNTIFTFKVTS